MITRFKLYSTKLNVVVENNIFENKNESDPVDDDYVIIEPKNPRMVDYPELFNFLINNIGQIDRFSNFDLYCISFEDVPFELVPYFDTDVVSGRKKKYYKFFDQDEIAYWSKNKKDLKIILTIIQDAKKYNV